MATFSQSKNFNINYASKIVRIEGIRKHSNADRLQIVTIDGNNCVVDLHVKEGDIMLYFPVESQLNDNFVKINNLYDKPEMNEDTEKKGHINSKRRIRALNLRGENSAGLLLPLNMLCKWLDIEDLGDMPLNEYFDTVNGKLLSKKYVVRYRKMSGKVENQRDRHVKRFDRILEKQFRFHIDTERLGINLDYFNIDDIIQISSKWHGTSFIASNIYCRRTLNFLEKMLLKLGIKIQTTEYDYIYASRTVIKNKYINVAVPSFFDEDVWKYANEDLKAYLSKGLSIYGEIVGYLPGTSTYIQKDYDYGCSKGEYKLYIYRITYTNPSGKVFEFSSQQVQEWCKMHGLPAVIQLYYGTIRNYLISRNITFDERNWRKKWYDTLANDFYMEQDDPDCNNQVPFEGVVVRKEKFGIESYKLKSQRFMQKESEELDKEVENIEENS